MAQAESALKMLLLYYIVIFAVAVLFTVVTVWKCRHDPEKMDKRIPFILAACVIALLAVVIGIIPVSRDYVNHHIV